jgi:hypothetical protein
MDQPPEMPSTSSPQATAKKGMPAIAWVGIGCGGLVLLALIAGIVVFFMAKGKLEEFAANPEKAGAEMIVSWNPDLEKISEDDEKGTMTIRTRQGKESTLSYKDISEGKITIADEDGNTTLIGSSDLSQVPAWVPLAPDLSDGVSTFHSNAGGAITGQFSGRSGKSLDDLKSFFEGEASSAGLSSSSSSSANMGATSVATLEFSGGGKSLNIVITEKPGSGALINTNYSEK